MRKLIGLLLLVVFFLSGMILGAQQPQMDIVNQPEIAKQVEVVTTVTEPEIPSSENNTDVVNVISEKQQEQPTNMTYQAAQSIEKASVWFYNQVIDVAYSISQVFI
ncbi:hypothetical protein [Paraliobacillus sp. X-1268]|uniref:hypothetical protein n=1 Tax=Paraliobacillus sp. X-1268 TaxID=2213193 RepID=UPI000E3E4239|nr:hypothetical protein [Paraliobacillus sp. X-1268]